jgi:hypothetical protein
MSYIELLANIYGTVDCKSEMFYVVECSNTTVLDKTLERFRKTKVDSLEYQLSIFKPIGGKPVMQTMDEYPYASSKRLVFEYKVRDKIYTRCFLTEVKGRRDSIESYLYLKLVNAHPKVLNYLFDSLNYVVHTAFTHSETEVRLDCLIFQFDGV